MANNRSIFIDESHDISIRLKKYYEENPYGERRYYGVTRVLSNTKSEEDKESLQKWRDSIGEVEAERIFQEAMSIGSSLDMLLEKELCDEFEYKKYKKEEGISLFYQLKPVINKLKPIGLQVHLYSDEYRIQGYLDAICMYKDKLTMVDFKNSRKRKDEKYLEDYFLQCTMYCMLIFKMTGILIKDICIMIAIRNDITPQIVNAKTIDYVVKAKERIEMFKSLKMEK